jgi:uncharacterized protein (DUF2336 family)
MTQRFHFYRIETVVAQTCQRNACSETAGWRHQEWWVVVEAQRSLIDEVEGAIASGSSAKRIETLRRITDLFMVGADDYSEDQVGLFDDVIAKLAEKIETKARAELATRLAPVKNAPIAVVRSLAHDEAIEVAGPVLTHSPRLSDEDIVAACANGGSGQDRLLAISKRASIGETVSDMLIDKGNQEVVRSVARNQGARLSNAGFGKLVERSAADDELALCVGERKDIPKEHFRALVAKASEAVAAKLAAANAGDTADVRSVLYEITGHRAGTAVKKTTYDYTQAKAAIEQLQKSGKPIEPNVQDFASSGKLEETIVAIATVSQLPIPAVERIFTKGEAADDLTLLLVKAAGWAWPTARLILALRHGQTGLTANAADIARRHFEQLQASTAQRLVRFYQVRAAAGETAH